MGEFREQTPAPEPPQEQEKDESKEKIDAMMPFLEGEAKMYNNASAEIESKTDAVKREGRMRKIQKAIIGSVGLTLLAGSMAMGVSSVYGGEKTREKTRTERIKKAPQGENIEKKEIREDEKILFTWQE